MHPVRGKTIHSHCTMETTQICYCMYEVPLPYTLDRSLLCRTTNSCFFAGKTESSFCLHLAPPLLWIHRTIRVNQLREPCQVRGSLVTLALKTCISPGPPYTPRSGQNISFMTMASWSDWECCDKSEALESLALLATATAKASAINVCIMEQTHRLTLNLPVLPNSIDFLHKMRYIIYIHAIVLFQISYNRLIGSFMHMAMESIIPSQDVINLAQV